MKVTNKHIGILVFLLLSANIAFSQNQQYDSFSPSDFFGEKEFLSASQDQFLNIYFKTKSEVLKFDGSEFSRIKLPIKYEDLNKIYAFKDKLFFSDNNKTYFLNLLNDSVNVVWDQAAIQFQQNEDQLWILSKTELIKLGTNLDLPEVVYSNEKNEEFYSFHIGQINTVIGHSNGLTVLVEGRSPASIGTFLSNPSKIISVDSNTYIHNENAVFNYANGRITRLFKNDIAIIDFFVDDFGKIWSVDSDGKLWVDNGIDTKSLASIIPNEIITVNKLFNDKENNLWILGKNKLLKIVQNNPFSRIVQKEIIDLFVGEKGTLLASSKELTYYNIYNKEITFKIPEQEIPVNNIQAFELDNTWIISFNKNIYSWKTGDSDLSLIRKNSNFIPFTYYTNDSLIAYNQRGDIFYVDKNVSPVQQIKTLNSAKKLDLSLDKIITVNNQNIVSTLNVATQKVKSISLPDSLSVTNLISASEGLWYFNEKEIYFISELGEITQMPISQYNLLQGKVIIKIFDDRDGNLWISTKNQLLRLPITFNEDKISSRNPIAYNKNDFLLSTFFLDVKKDPTGTLWFTHPNGISLFNPLKEIPNLVAPGISVEKAYSYTLDEFKNPVDTINLLDNKARIEKDAIVVIEARVINHLKNDKAQISYSNIINSQSERSIASGEKIILTDFEDGRNAIEIKAVNSDGIESVNKEIVNMTVIPPIWKRNWFYISGGLSLLLLGFIGYKTVIGLKNSRAKELEEELQKGLEDLEKKSHLQVLKAERLKQLNELITSQKGELEKKNTQIESQKYELSLTNQQIKKQKTY